MQSRKQILKETMKDLSAKERKDALKWIDTLSEKEINDLELLSKVQFAQRIVEQLLRKKELNLKKPTKRG